MSIKSEIEEFVSSLNFEDEISTNEFKTELNKAVTYLLIIVIIEQITE